MTVTIIIMILVTTLVFFLMKHVFINNDTKTNSKIIFISIINLIFNSLFVITFINDGNSSILVIIIPSLYLLITSLTWLLYNKNKYKGIKKVRVTKLKGLKAMFLSLIIMTLLFILYGLLITEFKSFSLFFYFLIILLILTFYYISLLRHISKLKIKEEAVIIFNNTTYYEYNLTNNYKFNLDKLLKDKSYNVESVAIMYLRYKVFTKVVWLYRISNYNISKCDQFNSNLLDILIYNNDEVIDVLYNKDNLVKYVVKKWD